MTYKITREHWERSQNEDYSLLYADPLLYELFAKAPPTDDHRSLNLMRSKLILLARVYLTGVERRGGMARLNHHREKGIEKLARTLWDDERFRDLPRFLRDEGLSRACFGAGVNIFRVHAQLRRTVRSATGSWESVFASKWLHFHGPELFPIFDSVVETNIAEVDFMAQKRTELRRSYRALRGGLGREGIDFDKRYSWYCHQLIAFREHVAALPGLTQEARSLRALDLCLYGLSER